jgi:O-antigen/teichoic acid export membrane protein
VASFSAEIGTAAPDLILGRTKGFSDVAYFSRANGLLSMAPNELSGVVQSVIVPLFAKGHRDGKNLSELYIQYSSSFLAIVLPVLSLLALLSDPLIDFMFGAQWSRSAPLASMLCVFAMMTGPVRLAPLVLVASGHVATLMRCHLMLVTAKVAILCASIFVSLEAVVASLALVYLLETVLFIRALRARIGVDSGALWRGIRSCYFLVPVTLILPALALMGLHSMQIGSSFVLLAVAGFLGMFSWIVGVFWLRHPIHLELANFVKKAGRFLGVQEKNG